MRFFSFSAVLAASAIVAVFAAPLPPNSDSSLTTRGIGSAVSVIGDVVKTKALSGSYSSGLELAGASGATFSSLTDNTAIALKNQADKNNKNAISALQKLASQTMPGQMNTATDTVNKLYKDVVSGKYQGKGLSAADRIKAAYSG